ncbi:hypothetical protein [Janthinobacterium sp. PC23-8]|uniref:hypothetical protein n=1 Tax=Janthinobacterium sp. PC23-8 TaxID=2012679 RepID=UPI000B973D01|nr:hypothetical protein [Janthinobacterium sp. PC23-8]OYO31727.1 hypothetical protein CD932_11780 [Janthinobacterium sp. PC23-8]
MASLSSINSLQASLATAQRRVEQGQNQVQRDSEQLADSRRQLIREKEQLSDTQRSTQQAQASSQTPVKVPQLEQAISIAVPPQLNSLGQSIGRLINTTA